MMRRWAVLLLTLAAVVVLTDVAATAGSSAAAALDPAATAPEMSLGSFGRGLHQARQPRTVVFESFLHGG